jgi:hypothetical protein
VKELFPYRELRGAVELRVVEATLDGKLLPWDAVFQDERVVQLNDPDGAPWDSARLRVELRGPEAELQARAGDLGRIRAVVVLNCGPSNTRVATELRPATAPATWQGEVDLDRPDWYGQATLRGTLVADIEGVTDRMAGFADSWTVRFDDLPPREVKNGMRITWVDFENPPQEQSFLHEYSADVFFLRIEPDEPQLYLNDAFEGLRSLLDERPRRPAAERALRDQVLADIAARTWQALFLSSLEAVQEDEQGDLQPPEADWQGHVLATLLPRLFPDTPYEESLKDAWTTRRESDGAARLQERLLPAAGLQADYPKRLRAGLKTISTDPEED